MAISRYKHVTAIALALSLASIATADITVRFDAPDVTVGLGDLFSVDIRADVPAGEPVLGWGLDLTIVDGLIASLSGAPVIGPLWFGAFAPDGDGLAAIAFPDSISGDDILLATITLSANALGETDLLLSTTAGDLTEGFPLDPMGFAGITFEPGHLTVIPAPGAALLGMIGLGVVGWVKRRHG